MAHMSFLAWIVLGLVAGFLASSIVNKTSGGLVADLILGVVGAFVGGFIVDQVPVFGRLFGDLTVLGHAVGPLVIALLGSILVLVIYHMAFRRGR